MDIDHEAKACTNELFYRNGPTPEDIRCADVEYVIETIKRYMWEAFNAGIDAALSSQSRGSDP